MENVKQVSFEDLRDIIKNDLEDQVDIKEFDIWFDKRMKATNVELEFWLSEAILNNYLRYLELKALIGK